jgi:hypothetical protein
MPLKKIAIGAGLVVAGVILVPTLVAPVAFDMLFPADAGTAQLSEWRVLRDAEASHRDAAHDAPALIVQGALESGYTAVGFPARGRDKGYVWVIANPSTDPRVKQLPADQDFEVSRATLDWLRMQTALDPRVAAYLGAPAHGKNVTAASQGQPQ